MISGKKATSGNLSVLPGIVEFKSIEVGKKYETTLVLQNLSKEPKNINIKLAGDTPSGVFSIPNKSNSDIYAPYGLDKKILLTFIPLEAREYSERLIVTSDSTIEIPLRGLLPAPDIRVGGDVDFGTVIVEHSVVKTVTIRNEGIVAGEYGIQYDTSLPLTISPTSSILQPNSSLQLQVRIEPFQLGVINTTATITFPKGSRTFHITATAVSQNVELLLPDGNHILESIHFGSMYFGQERTFNAILVNNAPHPSSFNTTIDSPTEDEEFLLTVPEISVEPFSGTIDPMSQMEIQFKFSPIGFDEQIEALLGLKNLRNRQALFAPQRDFVRTASINIVETGQNLDVSISGRAIKPNIELSANSFSFGESVVGAQVEQNFTITNKSDELPVYFNLQKVAHFKSTPPQGKLQPLQSQEISVIFAPKQMGVFNQVVELNICNGILILPIKLNALSANKASSPSEKSRFPAIKSPEKRTVSTGAALTEWIEDGDVDSVDVRMYEKKRDNQQHYVEFLRFSHADRVQKKLKQKALDVESQMQQESSPGGAITKLPKISEQYMNQYKSLLEKINIRKQVNELMAEDHFIKKKFKPKPTTQLEVRECKTKLSRADLFQSVTAGNKMFDFGSVCVYSEHSKSFNITNSLKQSILVALVIEHAELKKSNPLSQVIPPGQTAGFDVIFNSTLPQAFHSSINYTINGIHTYIITISAEVTPITIDVSKEQIHFRYLPDTWKPFVSELVTLTNSVNQVANFKCILGNNFAVEPAEGAIKAQSNLDLEVKFYPDSTGKQNYEETLIVKVNGGPDRLIKCYAKLPKINVVSSHNLVDFGIVAVGVVGRSIITLQNTSTHDAYFKCDVPINELIITPDTGVIRGGAHQEIELNLKPTKKFFYDITVSVNIPGMKPLKINIKARADIPTITILEEQFLFSGVYIGTSSKQLMTFTNTSMIPAYVSIDLSAHQQYYIVDVNPPSEIVYEELKRPETSGSISNVDKELLHKFQIESGKEYKVDIVYKPTKLVNEEFTIPIFINGVLSNVERKVTSNSLVPPVFLSETVYDFGNKVVLRDAKTGPYTANSILTNQVDRRIEWELGVDIPLVQKGIFVIEPRKGVLEKGEKATIRISFYPKERKNYSAMIAVKVDKAEKPFFEFEVKGNGVFPSIAFDVKEVVIPVVPVGFKSSTTFHILNKGYQELDIKHYLPADKVAIPIQISFPEGTLLSQDKQKIPVTITMEASKPLCFMSKIDFYDNTGQQFSVAVTGASDNSVMTVFPYLQNNQKVEYKFTKAKGTYLELIPDLGESNNSSTLEILQCAQWLDSNSSAHLAQLESRTFSEIPFNTKNLITYLNASILKNPITEFPEDFILNNGKTLFELIEQISQRKLPFDKNTTSKRGETIEQVMQRYEVVFVFLKATGGILPAIKPQHLLSLEDYIKYRNPNSQLRHIIERDFPKISTYCWGVLIYQVIKLFLLNRVTTKNFKNLPGIAGSKQDIIIPPSNVFSTSELILLKWLNYHYRKMDSSNRRIMNFDRDLKDGLVLASIIMSHVPSVKRLTTIFWVTSEPEHFQRNASNVIGAMKDLGLDYEITPNDIINPNPSDMILLVLYLYQHLPQFIPKEIVSFQGSLLEKVVKELELSNPTTVPLSYSISLEGPPDFNIPERMISIEPRGQKNLIIEFTGRFSKQVEARLTLFGKKKLGYSQNSVMVFLLKSAVTQQKPLRVIEFQSKLYEHNEFPIEILNPFPNQGKFALTIQQEIILPITKDGKQVFEKASKTELSECFICTKELITLNEGEHVIVPVHFVPIYMGLHICRMLFVDEKLGEFVIEIDVRTSLPERVDFQQWVTDEKSTMDKQISLQSSNPKLSQALSTLQRFYDMDAREKLKKGPKRVTPQISASNNFKLEYSNPYFSGASEISVKQGVESKLTVNFHPKDVGSYSCKVTVLSLMDVRIFEIEGVASAKSKIQNVEFSVAARQIVTQNIPIHNPSSKDWKFKATITGRYFSGPSEFLAPASKTTNYPLVFKPYSQGSIVGTLTLSNHPTCDFIYNLRGIADKPLPEDNIVVECQAKTKTSIFLKIKNLAISSSHPVEYSVQTDIPYVSGTPTVYVPPSESVKYELTINPQCSGVFNGAIIFTSADGNFSWYTVEIKASKPPPERIIEVKAVARLPVAIEISMHNPLDEIIDLECTYEGKGLFGDEIFNLGPKETSSYKLMFYPFTSGQQEGSVMFFHENLGEFWYQLKLIAHPSNPINVPLITCEVGKKKTYQIAIENPTEENFVLQVSNSNPQNFSMNPNNVTLSPWSRTDFQIIYFPSSLDKNENATLALSHPTAGDWIYNLQGRGIKPTSVDVTSVFSLLGESTPCYVTFMNPFGVPAFISTSLIVDEKNRSAFQFSEKEIEVAPFAESELPFIFTPKKMQDEYDCVIEVKKKDDGLSWRYPVKGIPEFLSKEILSVSCKSRTREEKSIHISLPEIIVESGQEDLFSYELKIPDGSFKVAAQRALEFNHSKTIIENHKATLLFDSIFTPLRAMKTEAELKITKANGGKWIFKISIEATEADIDDSIAIFAAPNKSAGVAFQVRNQLDYSSPFNTYFADGTSSEFSVSPKSGIMDSSQSTNPSVTFKVGFSPSTFHTDQVEGKLIIQTEEMEWIYRISGKHPSQNKKSNSSISLNTL